MISAMDNSPGTIDPQNSFRFIFMIESPMTLQYPEILQALHLSSLLVLIIHCPNTQGRSKKISTSLYTSWEYS